MLFIFGLLLLIPTCVEMFCWFNQTDPCYAALGHKLYLQMVTDDHYHELNLYKWIGNEKENIFKVKNKKEKKNESIRNRSEFIFNNGTLIINNVNRTDSGTYRLELYNSNGLQTHAVNLTVIVEAPIGSVEVSIKCWSSVEKRASCSSEGDQLIFSWTLNGQKLKDGNNTIHLDEETSGNITCTVNNHVSHGQNTISVNRCPETTTATVTSHLTSTVTNSTQTSGHGTSLTDHITACNSTESFSSSGQNLTHIHSAGAFPQWMLSPVTLIVLGSTTVIFILLVISVYHIYKKKKQLKPTAESNSTADVEYAVVSSHKKMKIKEEDVQYGEVTFTPAVSNIRHQYKEQEDCVYSQVLTN